MKVFLGEFFKLHIDFVEYIINSIRDAAEFLSDKMKENDKNVYTYNWICIMFIPLGIHLHNSLSLVKYKCLEMWNCMEIAYFYNVIF